MNNYTGKPELTTAEAITNDGFWSDLAMADLMTQYRIPSEYADEVIKDGLMLAMIEINRQLVPVKTALYLDYQDLETYTLAHSEQIGGVEVFVKKYEESVFSYAKALLLQQFKTMNRKPEAENQAKESPETEAYWMNKSDAAVAFLFEKLGIDRATGRQSLNAQTYLL